MSGAEPVSRKRTRNVGPGRFIKLYRRKKLVHVGVVATRTSNAQNHIVFYSYKASTHRSSSDTTVGKCSRKQKNSLQRRSNLQKPRSNLEDASNERERFRSTNPCRSQAKACKHAVGIEELSSRSNPTSAATGSTFEVSTRTVDDVASFLIQQSARRAR